MQFKKLGPPAALFAGAAALYLSTLSRVYNFDGVCFALHLESGDPRLLFHPNHLLYSAAGMAYWQLEGVFGLGRALGALQRMDALAGAAGVALLFMRLRRRFGDWPALAAGLGWGFTYGLWSNATDAQAYGLAALSGVFVLGELVDAAATTPRRAGLATAAFALFHQLGALAALPLAWEFFSRKGPRKAAAYLAWAFLPVFGAYALVQAVWPAGGPAETARWFLGNAAPLSPLDPIFMTVTHSTSSFLARLGQLWSQGGVWLAGEPCPGLLGRAGPLAAWGLVLGLLWKTRSLAGEEGRQARALRAWLGVYLGFLLLTHDRNIGYLLFAFLPLPVLALFAARERPARLALAGVVACLFIANGSAALRSRSYAANPDWPRLSALARRVTPDDFLLFSGRKDFYMGRAYLPYFTEIPGTSLVGYFWRRGDGELADLGRTLEAAQKKGGQVYVLSGALDGEELDSLEAEFRVRPGRLRKDMLSLPLEPVEDIEPGLTLYRLERGYKPPPDF